MNKKIEDNKITVFESCLQRGLLEWEVDALWNPETNHSLQYTCARRCELPPDMTDQVYVDDLCAQAAHPSKSCAPNLSSSAFPINTSSSFLIHSILCHILERTPTLQPQKTDIDAHLPGGRKLLSATLRMVTNSIIHYPYLRFL